MRHRKKNTILNRQKGPRKALFRTQMISLVEKKKIKTTLVKAKILRTNIEKLITKAKKQTLAGEREVYKELQNKKSVKELVKNIAPKLKDRKGGYTRIIKLGYRKGDGAPMAQIEIILE